jgi:hypothetical protein
VQANRGAGLEGHGSLVAPALAIAVAIVAGCLPAVTVTPAPTSSSSVAPGPLSRPEGVERVVKVEANTPIGYRLHLKSGMVLTLEPERSETLISTTNGPDSLAVYGHDDRGLWLLWLAEDPNRGPSCFALPKVGYDRGGSVGWPNDRFELPKATNFRVESGIIVEGPGSALAGAYTNGGIVPEATFCISELGQIESVSP